MTTVEALKSIFVALGGSADTFNAATIPEALAKIATVVPSVELPAVTAADNGKVLTVVEGAWTKAAVPSDLPTVTAADNNKVLTVVEGAWADAAVPSELPAVSADDNGKVLKVVEGAWAVGTDDTAPATE